MAAAHDQAIFQAHLQDIMDLRHQIAFPVQNINAVAAVQIIRAPFCVKSWEPDDLCADGGLLADYVRGMCQAAGLRVSDDNRPEHTQIRGQMLLYNKCVRGSGIGHAFQYNSCHTGFLRLQGHGAADARTVRHRVRAGMNVHIDAAVQ